MKTAVIYARYSCDKQTEQSIEGQLSVCNDFAKKNNILILKTYIDQAMSGTNDNRPSFQQMIKDSHRKEWDYVLVYKLDRFSRNKYETAIHKKTLRDNNIKVLSAMENIPDTPEGIILESLLEGMNQYYSAELAQKVKRGMKETRKKGLFQGGKVLYGYKLDGRKIVVNEETAPVVKFIYEQYSLGVYVKDIIKQLTANKIYKHGKPFAMNTIYGILKNEKYSGSYKFNEEIIDNMYPQIVPTEIYKKVRSLIDSNKYGKHTQGEPYYLRNKIFCGYCGLPIVVETGTSYNGVLNKYYKCSGRKSKRNNCKKSIVRKNDLEKLVIDNIVKELSKPDILDKIVKGLMLLQDKQIKENSFVNNLIKTKANVEKALDNLVSAIEQGIVSKTTTKRLHELENQIEELERKILIEKSKEQIKLPEKTIRAFYEEALKLNPKSLIIYVVNQIKLFDDKIEIILNNPINNSPDIDGNVDDQGFSFFEKFAFLQAENIFIVMKV